MFSKEEILNYITTDLTHIEDKKEQKASLSSLLKAKTNALFSKNCCIFIEIKEEDMPREPLNQAWIYRELCIWAKNTNILTTQEIADVVLNKEVYENEDSLEFPEDDDWEEIKTAIQRRKASQPASEDADIASSPQPMSPSTSDAGFELAYNESRHQLIDLLAFHRQRGHKGNKEIAAAPGEWEEIDLTDSETQIDTQEIINEINNIHVLEDSLFEVAQAIIKEADIEKARLLQLHQAGKIDTATLQSNMERLTSTLNDTAVVLQDPTAPEALDALQNLQKNLPKQNEKMSTLTKILIVLGVILAVSVVVCVVVGILVGLSLLTHGAILPAMPHILSALHTVVLPYFTAAGPWAHIGALIQSGTAPALAAVKGFVTGPFIHFVSFCQANAMHFVYQPIAHASSSFAAQLYHGFHSPTFTFVGKIIGYSVAALVGMVALCFVGEAMKYAADSIFNQDDENNSIIDDASSEHDDKSVYDMDDDREKFDNDNINVNVTDDDDDDEDNEEDSVYDAFMDGENNVIITPGEDLSESNSLQRQQIAKQTVADIRKQKQTRTAEPSADNPEHKAEGITHKPFTK